MGIPTDLAQLSSSAARWGLIAAILGGLSVGLGAFGAHGLADFLKDKYTEPELLTKRLGDWETAARYQMYHALALLAVAWLVSRQPSLAATAAGLCFLAGTLIFSGCLYALVLSGIKILGAVVPIGGVLLIVGWLAFATAFARSLVNPLD